MNYWLIIKVGKVVRKAYVVNIFVADYFWISGFAYFMFNWRALFINSSKASGVDD